MLCYQLPAASFGSRAAYPPSEWRLRNQNPALIFVLMPLTARSEELGQRRLLSDCGCGPMNLSACLPFGECVNVARGVQGKQATSYCTSTGVRAGTACRNIAGYRNAKCKAQEAVVLRLVRDAVPNHRTGVSEGVCLGRARRM
jgi:hypothetical protein